MAKDVGGSERRKSKVKSHPQVEENAAHCNEVFKTNCVSLSTSILLFLGTKVSGTVIYHLGSIPGKKGCYKSFKTSVESYKLDAILYFQKV